MGVQILGGQVFVAVLVFTYVLAFVVLSVATVGITLYEYFGFAVGMRANVGGFAIGKVSGGSLNLAVSIGISTSHIIGGGGFWPCLIYTVVELVAGALAAGVFIVTQLRRPMRLSSISLRSVRIWTHASLAKETCPTCAS